MGWSGTGLNGCSTVARSRLVVIASFGGAG